MTFGDQLIDNTYAFLCGGIEPNQIADAFKGFLARFEDDDAVLHKSEEITASRQADFGAKRRG